MLKIEIKLWNKFRLEKRHHTYLHLLTRIFVYTISRWQVLIKFKSLYRTGRPFFSSAFSVPQDSPFPFFSGPLLYSMVESEAIRRFPLAARRIVTKGFAVILDLICMLMVMDVYLLLFPGFVAACLSYFVCCRGLGRNAGSHDNVCLIRSRCVCTCLLRASVQRHWTLIRILGIINAPIRRRADVSSKIT